MLALEQRDLVVSCYIDWVVDEDSLCYSIVCQGGKCGSAHQHLHHHMQNTQCLEGKQARMISHRQARPAADRHLAAKLGAVSPCFALSNTSHNVSVSTRSSSLSPTPALLHVEMDSMRHLSTSLPRASRRRQEQTPELIGEFKAAALSVTNLYKSAAASQEKARSAGYQDALDDVLAFLDSENLGLMDGEGWRVRQWATERLVDDGVQRQDEGGEEEQRQTSPDVQRKEQVPEIAASSSELSEDAATRRTAVSEPPEAISSSSPLPQPLQLPASRDFTFSTSTPYPSNHDREDGMDLDATPATTASTPTSTESVRIISRPHRGRHTNHNRRNNNNSMPTLNLSLGAGAGNKRKMPYSDFFDISGMDGHDRRGSGDGKGGKRGRHA